MPGISQEYMQKLQNLQMWEGRVSNMATFSIPERYELGGVKGKYARFMGFVEMWITETFRHTDDVVSDDAAMMEFGKLKLNMTNIPLDWFNHAKDIGSGKKVDNNLPTTQEPIADEEKKIVYKTFLPAYRAIKEKFERRSFWQFIFNHAQYTAERDALRAIEGVVTTLTGEGKAGLEAAYAQYKEELPSSNIAEALIHESNRMMNEHYAQIDAERDQEAERERIIAVQIAEEKQKEIEEIASKAHNDLTCGDQATILTDDETYKKTTQEEILKALDKSPFSAKKTLIPAMLYNPLIGEAMNISKTFDSCVAEGDSKEELSDYLAAQAKNMFTVAFNKLTAFKLQLQDRLVAAQKITDIVLNSATPVAFKQNEYGKYGDSFAIKNDEFVRNVISGNGIKADEETVTNAINGAKKELGAFEKERVDVVLDDAVAPNTQRIDEQVMSAAEKNLG